VNADQSDFNPIRAEGQLERRTGLRAWRRRRDELPAASPGLAVVVVDGRGNIMSGESFTAGEQFWGSGTWQTIDLGDHELRCTFPCRSADGRAGYVVEVQVLARVEDPMEVVRRRISTVAGNITPQLRAGVVQHAVPNGARTTARRDDTVALVHEGRSEFEAAVRSHLVRGEPATVEKWLTYRVLDAAVGFDEATREHLETLVGQERTTEISVRDLENQKRTAKVQIELRETWSEHLTKVLSDPLSRAVAAAVSDPTQANIATAVHQLNSDERATREQVMTALDKLINSNLVENVNQLETIRVIFDGVQRTAIGLQLEEGPSARPVIEGSTVDADAPEPDAERAEPSDRDWGDA
jgi:hypothetical protein